MKTLKTKTNKQTNKKRKYYCKKGENSEHSECRSVITRWRGRERERGAGGGAKEGRGGTIR